MFRSMGTVREAARLPPLTDLPKDRRGRPVPEHIGEALAILQIILTYARHLADTLEHRAVARGFFTIAQFFGTARLPAIRARLARGILRITALQNVLLARAARAEEGPAGGGGRRPAAASQAAGAPPRYRRPARSRQPAHPGAARGRGPPPPVRPQHGRHLPRHRRRARPVRRLDVELRVLLDPLVPRQHRQPDEGFPPPRDRLRAGVGPQRHVRDAGAQPRRRPPHAGLLHRRGVGDAPLGAHAGATGEPTRAAACPGAGEALPLPLGAWAAKRTKGGGRGRAFESRTHGPSRLEPARGGG